VVLVEFVKLMEVLLVVRTSVSPVTTSPPAKPTSLIAYAKLKLVDEPELKMTGLFVALQVATLS
jgi:hypothetical protein